MDDLIPVARPWLGAEEAAAVAEVLDSGWVAQGPRVAEFESALASRCEADRGVATSSCTTALHLTLHALGVGPADEVIVPSLSFIASTNAVRYVGATPVFADVDRVTQNATADTIERVLSPRTRAAIVVHQVGMPADLDPIRDLLGARGIAIVEDAACAVGSTYRGRPVGAGPDPVCFSFHPRKLLTTGEGGMVLTSDAALADRLSRLRTHAPSLDAFERHAAGGVVFERYEELGFNFRMTDLQAAVGIAQLAKLDAMVERRRALATRYEDRLRVVPGLITPTDPPYGTTNYQSYAIQLGDEVALGRDEVMQALLERGVSTRRGIMAAHLEPVYGGSPSDTLAVTEWLTRRSIILPLYHEMADGDVDRVAEAVAATIAASSEAR